MRKKDLTSMTKSVARAKDFKAASKDAVQFKLENPLNHIKSLKKVLPLPEESTG